MCQSKFLGMRKLNIRQCIHSCIPSAFLRPSLFLVRWRGQRAEYRQHALCGFLEEVSARLELFVSLLIFHVVKFFSLPLQNSRSKALIIMCKAKIQEKTWESLLLAYPVLRLSHCPPSRIGNAVSPRRDILRTAMAAARPWGYNTSHVDVPVAVSSDGSSNLRDLSIEDNVRKRPLPVNNPQAH